MGRRKANTDLRTQGGGSSQIAEAHPRTGRGGKRNDLGKISVVKSAMALNPRRHLCWVAQEVSAV